MLRDVKIEGNTVLDGLIRGVVSPMSAGRSPPGISRKFAGGSRFSTSIEAISTRARSSRIKTSKTGSLPSDYRGTGYQYRGFRTDHFDRNTFARVWFAALHRHSTWKICDGNSRSCCKTRSSDDWISNSSLVWRQARHASHADVQRLIPASGRRRSISDGWRVRGQIWARPPISSVTVTFWRPIRPQSGHQRQAVGYSTPSRATMRASACVRQERTLVITRRSGR